MNVKELIAELQSKVMIDVKEGEILCPDCKGLRFKYTEKYDKETAIMRNMNIILKGRGLEIA